MHRKSICIIFLLLFIIPEINTVFAGDKMPTPIEVSGYRSLPESAGISIFLEALSSTSPYAKTMCIGRSAGGRDITALLVSKDADFLNKKVTAAGKITVMLLGGQHGTEPSGTEALQQIARDIVQGTLGNYPEDINFIIIPNSNPDGRDLKKRVNAAGVNLSTDYVTLSQPESRAIVKILKQFSPHVLLDVHESAILKKKTLGAQGYLTDFEVQFEIPTHPNIDRHMQNFGLTVFLPALLKAVNGQGLHADRYIGEITDIGQPITHGGLSLRNLRNYAGFQRTFAVLVENKLDPPGVYPTPRNIKVRIDKQIISILTFLQQIKLFHRRILVEVRDARKYMNNFKKGAVRIALVSCYDPHPSQKTITLPLRRRDTNEKIEMVFRYHGQVRAGEWFVLPKAYVVTAHQELIAALLERHQILFRVILEKKNIKAVCPEIKEIHPAREQAFTNREKLEFITEEKPANITLKPGDLWIPLDQPSGRLIPLLFEPGSTENIFQHLPYRSILKQGQRFFIHRIEE